MFQRTPYNYHIFRNALKEERFLTPSQVNIIFARDDFGNTPVQLAATSESSCIARILLDVMKDNPLYLTESLEGINNRQETPLHRALKDGDNLANSYHNTTL